MVYILSPDASDDGCYEELYTHLLCHFIIYEQIKSVYNNIMLAISLCHPKEPDAYIVKLIAGSSMSWIIMNR